MEYDKKLMGEIFNRWKKSRLNWLDHYKTQIGFFNKISPRPDFHRMVTLRTK
jgi:hypothetical protein